MASRVPRSCLAGELPVLVEPVRSRRLVSVSPAATPNHLVIRPPPGKCVIRSVENDEAAAVLYVLLKRSLGVVCPFPVGSVQIGNDHLVIRKLWVETAKITFVWRGRDDLHLNHARVFQNLLQNRRSGFPGVVRTAAFTIQNHDPDIRG